MRKKHKKNKNNNQTSFFFEDYLETNKKNKILNKSSKFQDRIYVLFFFLFSLILIFSIKITHVSFTKKNLFYLEKQTSEFSLNRRDIVDRNGVIISRNINTSCCSRSKIVKDKKFLIKLRLNFPELSIDEIQHKLNKNKYFRLKKRIDQVEKENFGRLEKVIKFEPFSKDVYSWEPI